MHWCQEAIVWPYLPDSCSRSWITWLLIKYNCCKAEKMSSMASAIISTGSDDESYQSWLTDVCDWVVPEFGDLIMFVRLLLSCHGLLVCWIWPYLPDSYPRSQIARPLSKYWVINHMSPIILFPYSTPLFYFLIVFPSHDLVLWLFVVCLCSPNYGEEFSICSTYFV